MSVGGVFSALLVGLIVGALGRLVVPGRQKIGIILTLLLGVVGAIAGLAIAHSADVNNWFLILLCQVAIAAVGVAVVSGFWRSGSWRGRRIW